MFCKRSPHKKIESMASILLLGGVLPLCVAMVAQYRFHLPPCHFCMLQRYPYALVMFLGIGSLLVARGGGAWKACVLLGLLCFFTSGALGLYHTGIEQGWVAYHGGCVADGTAQSVADIRSQILSAPKVSCADATAQFAGLSMASWNAIYAACMVLLTLAQYRFEKKRHG